MMTPERGQEMMLEMLTRELKLAPGQRQQFERMIEEARDGARPLHEQMQKLRAQTREAVIAGKGEAEVNLLADQAGAVFARINGVQNRAFRQAVALLSDEQKKQGELLYDALSMALAGGGRGRAPLPAGHPAVPGAPSR
jgi:Spy/CpxP family protein refolding chaperone